MDKNGEIYTKKIRFCSGYLYMQFIVFRVSFKKRAPKKNLCFDVKLLQLL